MTAIASVGLSFGSESCVVAVTNTFGHPQVYANADGERVTPTYVAFIDGEVLHGNAARAAFVRQPVQTVPFLFPLLSTEVVNSGLLHAKCEIEVAADPATGEERVVIPTADVDGVLASALPKPSADEATTPHLTTELITSFLNDVKVKTIEGPCTGRPIGCLTVAIPRYLDQSIVRSAVESAGLAKDVRVIFDDVAAIMAANIASTGMPPASGNVSSPKEKTDVAIIDWGANVLSASIIRVEGGTFRLLSHTHRFGVGANALDKHMTKACCDSFFKKTKMNAAENSKAIRKLLFSLEGVRKALSMSMMSPIDVEAFFEGMDYKDNLSRVKLDMAIRDSGLIEKLKAVLKELVEGADASENINIEHVILAGGLTRVPFIQRSVKEEVVETLPGAAKATIYDELPSDEIAALGACSEAVLTTATHSALTKPAADVLIANKYRPIAENAKTAVTASVPTLDATVALYTGSTPFAKLTASNGAYEVPLDQLYYVTPRGAPLPVSSPLIAAAVGAAVTPVAVTATTGTAASVVPLLKKTHKLATPSFKVLVAAEKAGTSVTVVEQDAKGAVKVAVREEL